MGLEIVVRPMVLPNIRPAVPIRIAPPDDPTKGIATLSGGGGKFIGTSRSWSTSVSKSMPQLEDKRQFNKERIYQVDASGNINKSVFVDVERLKKVQTNDGSLMTKVIYADPPKPSPNNIETLQTDAERSAGG